MKWIGCFRKVSVLAGWNLAHIPPVRTSTSDLFAINVRGTLATSTTHQLYITEIHQMFVERVSR